MPKEFGRNQRIAEFIRQELAVLIQRAFPLQEYGMITLSNVDVSPNLESAKIFVTVLSEKKSNEELVAALNEQAGHLRHELSKMLTSRGVPTLKFQYDESIARAQRLDAIIDSVSKRPDETD
jgi:ribosome-binding factor A